jgi:hypothetical protein
MNIKSKELGVISVDAGDVVCLSMDCCLDIAKRLNMSVDNFIRNFRGVKCEFHSDGGYGVDKVTAVQQDGSTCDMVLIGGDTKNLRRFLNEDEQGFNEFMDSHPRNGEIGFGKEFNGELFAEIADEHRRQLLDNPSC